jgi:hypothetical protein
VKKKETLNDEKAVISTVYSGNHNHDPLGILSHEILVISLAITEQKLDPLVSNQVKSELMAGKKPKEIYRDIVRNAENPLNTHQVPSKNQVQYLARKVLLEQLPADGVSYYFFLFDQFRNYRIFLLYMAPQFYASDFGILSKPIYCVLSPILW